MLQLLKKNFKRGVATLLVFSLVFCTNAFNTVSRVYADGNSEGEKIESTVKDSADEKSNAHVVDDSSTVKDEKNNTDEKKSTEEKKETSLNDTKDDEVSEATESEVDEAETEEEETTVSTMSNVVEKEESEESEATKSEIVSSETKIEEEKENDIEDIATESEIEEIATISELDIEYKELDAYNQFLYQDQESVSKYDNIIILLKDVKLDKPVYINNDETLDLSGHTLVGPDDNYTLFIENNFTLANSGDEIGKIEGSSNNFPTINANNASLELLGGAIYGASGKANVDENVDDKEDDKETAKEEKKIIDGGDAIHLYDSNIVVNKTRIYGGKGFDQTDDRGGNGGDAIVVESANGSNTIDIVEGSVVGGHAGDGYGGAKPGRGAALKVEDFAYQNEYLGRGLAGNIGGGTGGNGINIKTDKFKSDNLTYEKYKVSAGNSGYSIVKSVNESKIVDLDTFNNGNVVEEESNPKLFKTKLFGAGSTDPYYSLHDLNGNNYLTSLKYQNLTGLCTAFAFTAYAETNLIKKYPDFVKNILNKNVNDTLNRSKWHTTNNPSDGSSTDNTNELNLSEIQFGMQLFTQPRDEFGNAGLSNTSVGQSSSWAGNGSNSFTLSLTAPTWRSLVEEDNAINWPEWGDQDSDWSTSAGHTLIYNPIDRALLNNYTNKTVVHAKDALVRDLGDYYDGTTFRRDEFLRQAKKDILKYNGFELFVYTLDRQATATINNPEDPTNPTHYIKNGVDYGVVTALDAESVTTDSLGGHAIYCIGWDDDVEFTGSFGTYTGAFICKNSWHQFTLVPYDNAWGVKTNEGTDYETTWYMDYMVSDFSPSFSEYENIYFYDSGVSTVLLKNDYAKSIFNTYEIRNAREKIKALSFYSVEPGNYNVTLYKVTSLDNTATLLGDLSDANNKLYETTVSASAGMNTVNVDSDIYGNDGDMFAVKVEYGKGTAVSVDRDAPSNGYMTENKGRSFYTDFDSPIVQTINYGANARIRLITNNVIKLDANWDSSITTPGDQNGHFGTADSVAWFEPTLRASLSNITEPTPKAGKVFVNYNTAADGSGTTYDNNSLYHLDIARYLTLYAQYADSTDIKTLHFEKGHASATGSMNDIKRENGTVVKAPTATFNRTGYKFDYWEDGSGNHINAGDPITLNADITLTAVWSKKTYTIDYELNGGRFVATSTDHPTSIEFEESIPVPATTSVVYTGHIFKGWYDNEELSGSKVTTMRVDNTNPEDLRYYAKWDIEKFTVTFDMQGHGTQVPDQIVNYGAKIIRPTDPTAEGYAFAGWYTDDTFAVEWNFTDKVYEHKNLVAKWVEAISVKFVTAHGKTPATQYIMDGSKATEPSDITVVGYDFNYWYENDENTPYDFNTVLNIADGNMRTLTAKWTAKTYNITYDTNGGTINGEHATTYTYGVGATLPTSVTSSVNGRTFAGWYDNEKLSGKAITSITATDYGDKKYYAKYNRVSNGGSPSGTNGGSTGGSATGGNVTSPAFTDLKLGPEANPLHDTTLNISLKTIPITMNTAGSTWETDANGNQVLTLKNSLGVPVEAKNIFACVVTSYVDKDGLSKNVQDFYYFDSNGKMYTGWLRDTSNTAYYFKEDGYELGKLARGWTAIRGDYYYFDYNGNLQKSTITPDGYALDASGKWIENAGQEGFINVNKNIVDPAANVVNSVTTSVDGTNATIYGVNNGLTTNNGISNANIANNTNNTNTNSSSVAGGVRKRTGKVLDK